MVTEKLNSTNVSSPAEQEMKKKSFWGKVGNFMMMGGFLLVIIVAVAIYIGISMIFK